MLNKPLRSKMGVSRQNLVSSNVDHNTHLYQVTSISDQQLFSFCADAQTDTAEENTCIVQYRWHTGKYKGCVACVCFRDRVIHLLAVRAYKKPELILRLQRGVLSPQLYLSLACCINFHPANRGQITWF